MTYANTDKAVAISGLASGDFTANLLAWVDDYIDTWFGRSFDGTTEITTSSPEIHDIPDLGNVNCDTLRVKYYPVTAISRLRDNIRDNSPTTVNALNYILDSEAGLIKLAYNLTTAASGITQITSFTKGYGTVDVAYTYGFSSVPTEIQSLATLIASKIASYIDVESNISSGALEEVEIGNYREKYNFKSILENVKTKYDDEIGKLFLAANKWRMMV